LAGIQIHARREYPQIEPEILQLGVADAVWRAAVTNEQGEFELAPLAPGDYQVRADDPGNGLPSDDCQRRPLAAVFAPQKVTLRESQTPEAVEIRAVPHVKVEAQCMDSESRPCRGYGVFLFGKQEDGRWRSSQLLPDEDLTITVQADGYEPRGQTVRLSEGAQKDLEVVLEKRGCEPRMNANEREKSSN
jgi:hypothetical protein